MFQVAVAVNSKRTVNEASSMEIWLKYQPISPSKNLACRPQAALGLRGNRKIMPDRWGLPKHGGACCEKPSGNWQRMI